MNFNSRYEKGQSTQRSKDTWCDTSSEVFWCTEHNNTMKTEITTVNDSYSNNNNNSNDNNNRSKRTNNVSMMSAVMHMSPQNAHIVVETTYHQ